MNWGMLWTAFMYWRAAVHLRRAVWYLEHGGAGAAVANQMLALTDELQRDLRAKRLRAGV